MKKLVRVTREVVVEVDESKFTEDFMKGYRESFYNINTVEEHIESLGELYLRGYAENNQFIGGYGPCKEMGIKFSGEDTYDLESEDYREEE